jgi:dihydrofolate reductase
MQIVIVAAVAENGVIGRGGTMPWRLKSDMRHFRALTLGRPVVMGRKTYLSLSIKPLPGRTNIVVSRDPGFTAPGVLVAPSLAAALQSARADALRRRADAVAVIGGADIYAQAMPFADRLEITVVRMSPEGDTRFPHIDPAIWQEAARTPHPAGSGDDAPYDFVSYLKASAARGVDAGSATLGRSAAMR